MRNALAYRPAAISKPTLALDDPDAFDELVPAVDAVAVMRDVEPARADAIMTAIARVRVALMDLDGGTVVDDRAVRAAGSETESQEHHPEQRVLHRLILMSWSRSYRPETETPEGPEALVTRYASGFQVWVSSLPSLHHRYSAS